MDMSQGYAPSNGLSISTCSPPSTKISIFSQCSKRREARRSKGCAMTSPRIPSFNLSSQIGIISAQVVVVAPIASPILNVTSSTWTSSVSRPFFNLANNWRSISRFILFFFLNDLFFPFPTTPTYVVEGIKIEFCLLLRGTNKTRPESSISTAPAIAFQLLPPRIEIPFDSIIYCLNQLTNDGRWVDKIFAGPDIFLSSSSSSSSYSSSLSSSSL